MTSTITALSQKANNLRIHSIVSTSESGSGHPTTCMSAADIVSVLFFHSMRYDIHHADHPNNDRFVLSKGHAAPLLYAAWAEAGIIEVDDLLNLRKIDSDLEGHPTPRLPWVDVATGSLGQGLSVGLGMAINGKYLDQLDYRVYVLMGDGETAEGGVWEAAALAAHYKLDNLVGIVDVNGIGQSQQTMYGFDVDSYCRRFESFGWNTISIDGHDIGQIISAFIQAHSIKEQPTMIVAKTFKGRGVSFTENVDGWHGKSIPDEQLEQALKELGPVVDVPVPIQAPTVSKLQSQSVSKIEPPKYQIGNEIATRSGYGTALAKLAAANPNVVALDGDTKNSTYAEQILEVDENRYFEMYIAEQNLVGAGIGLSKRGKIPFVSTFAAFFARAYDQIRMSAISQANIKYVGSHCGASIGEDGPSQMGLEDLAMFRAIPDAVVLYPSDPVATERLVAESAEYDGIVFLRTSRPKTSVIYNNKEMFPIGGSKILRSSENDQITVVGAGVTVHEILKAYRELRADELLIRVIDLYSVKPIDAQTLIKSAESTGNIIITVEDHYPEGGIGEAVQSAVSENGICVHKLAINGIPRSGQPDELLRAFGIDANSIVKKVKAVLSR
ncbi:transketolase [Candidatus Poribacteria bacterium]|nr:transketolase [Candidatus Poribacteria bacterium]